MIAVIQGGHESEAEISRMTSKSFQEALKTLNLQHIVLEYDKDLEKNLQNIQPKVCLLALHGTHGEDGVIQTLLEKLKLPYTGSGVTASDLSFDKIRSIKQAKILGVPTLPSFLLSKNKNLTTDETAEILTWEDGYVVKPSRSGSSRGVSLCTQKDELFPAIEEAYKWCDEIMLEKRVIGGELSISVLNNRSFEPVEIRPKTGFYDMKNKYTKGATDYLVPAQISENLKIQLKNSALKVYNNFKISTYCRVDFLFKNNTDEFYFMEVNTLPGCTETSLFPKALDFEGLHFEDLIKALIKGASLKS